MFDIIYQDEYTLYDKLSEYKRNKNIIGPLGWVRAFLNDQLVVDKPNLVVAQGREFVANKTFEVNVVEDGSTRPDYTSYKISHFGIGSGGSSVVGDQVTLLGPDVCDTSLYSPIALSDGGVYLTEPSGVDYVLKPITTDGSIYLEAGNLCSPDYYTKVKCTCRVIASEPTTLQAGDSVKIDEAALYFSNGTTSRIFSHICFTPKWKEKESEFVLIWYILY
jgi:hypothetical protein